MLRAVPKPPCGLVQPGLFGASDVVILGAPSMTFGRTFVEALERRGVRARLAEAPGPTTDAVIHLGPLAAAHTLDDALAVTREVFRAARALAPRLGAAGSEPSGAFVVVEDLGGDFGLSGSDRAWLGGLSGLAKTLRQEWPRAAVRAIDLDGGAGGDLRLVERLADELVSGGPEVEVGLRSDGTRLVLESVPRDVPTGDAVLGRGDVVVVSGGARGVTAACVVELVRRTGARVVLLGRSTLEEEPLALAGVQGDAELKRAVLEHEKARGTILTPPELRKRVDRIVASRQVRATLEACRAVGGEAHYVAVDVQDAVGVSVALEEVRAAWGPVRGLVHGAGVIADRLIADKTDEQWDRVLDTKVRGLAALLEATKDDPLRAIVLFSSVAGRTGNVGQSDYATANEILNKVATLEARRRRASGQDVVVRSLGWGPWEAGMVSPALKARFEALGVRLIGLREGAGWMCDELVHRDFDDVEIVLGGEPRPEALLVEDDGSASAQRPTRFEVRISGATHPFVDSHRVKGGPVLPAVTAIDLFMRAAQLARPGEPVSEIEDIKVLQGIRLGGYDGPRGEPATGAGDRFLVEVTTSANDSTRVAARLLSRTPTGRTQKHYAATLVFGSPRAASDRPLDPGPLALVRSDVYDGFVLFHGPLLRAIESVEGESDSGIRGTLVGRDVLGWRPDPAAPTDEALLDGALQLAVLHTKRTHRGASLPTAIARFVPGPAMRTRERVRCTVRARGADAERARYDVELVDARGLFVARFEGLEVVVLPGSREQLARSAAVIEAE